MKRIIQRRANQLVAKGIEERIKRAAKKKPHSGILSFCMSHPLAQKENKRCEFDKKR